MTIEQLQDAVHKLAHLQNKRKELEECQGLVATAEAELRDSLAQAFPFMITEFNRMTLHRIGNFVIALDELHIESKHD